ncbi:TauD/TfdA dioxygenase family protein [Tomitella biformata]|uniref:TauD/TfdA dioxygenase family protein n=1 Tax=Tomitella biformata TaxID=630403 RepID=UPI0005702F9D|nr:TauD/TfdA family dioxygenase [Tomitella biformata]
MHPTASDVLYASGPLVAARLSEHMERRDYQGFTVHPVTPTIGAEIEGLQIGGELSESVLAELRRALHEFKVLVFRDQDIDRDGHRRFASCWGPIERHPFTSLKASSGQTDADVATLVRHTQRGAIENNWHNDVSWHERPSVGAVLRAVEVPAVGGDTLWVDTGAAYDLLPESVRQRIDGLWAEHDWRQTEEFGQRMTPDEIGRFHQAFPPVEHPIVWEIPETGRRVLFVNTIFTTRIIGLGQEESDELLTLLYRHIRRPEFQFRLRWRPDTVAIWDNRSTQHYASSDYFPQRRVMDRISIGGVRPVGIGGK